MPKLEHTEGNVTIKYQPPTEKNEYELAEKALFKPSYKLGTTNMWKEATKPLLQERFTYIIRTAPEMVVDALTALNQYESQYRTTAQSGGQSVPNAVWYGLAKYFALLDWTADVYWTRVHGIKQTFEFMRDGLLGVYTIELRLPSVGVMGNAYAGALHGGPKQVGVSPIRERFGGEDEWGHTEWQGFDGPILFSTNFFANGEKDVPKESINEMMARVLVHEASHRWGNTTDVLYKNSTFGMKASVYDKKILARVTQQDDVKEARKLFQAAESIKMVGVDLRGRADKKRKKGGDDKGFIGMKGSVGSDSLPIPDLRWLENADSYAWFARRIWKHAH